VSHKKVMGLSTVESFDFRANAACQVSSIAKTGRVGDELWESNSEQIEIRARAPSDAPIKARL
jgi:hypothetical protein